MLAVAVELSRPRALGGTTAAADLDGFFFEAPPFQLGGFESRLLLSDGLYPCRFSFFCAGFFFEALSFRFFHF